MNKIDYLNIYFFNRINVGGREQHKIIFNFNLYIFIKESDVILKIND